MPKSRKRNPKRRTSERPDNSAAPRIREIMEYGWCRRDADHLAVIEAALEIGPVVDRGARQILAKHAGTALAWLPTYLGAQFHYADEGYALPWRELAECLDAGDEVEIKRRMLTLAGLCEGREVLTVNREDLPKLLTEEDITLTTAARAAEASGDFEKALEMLRKTVRPLDDGWVHDLERLVETGDQLSQHQWGRFVCSAALRSCLEHPLGLQASHHAATVILNALGVSAEDMAEQAVERAVSDQLVHDVVLFDEGGLAAYLDTRLAVTVAGRVPGIDRWPLAPVSVVKLEGCEANGDARCRDLVSGQTVIVGDANLAASHPTGRCFYGRLVAIDGEDGRLFFAMRPTIVDEFAAATVAAVIRRGGTTDECLTEIYRRFGAAAGSGLRTANTPE